MESEVEEPTNVTSICPSRD